MWELSVYTKKQDKIEDGDLNASIISNRRHRC